jgi:hypothetical protein
LKRAAVRAILVGMDDARAARGRGVGIALAATLVTGTVACGPVYVDVPVSTGEFVVNASGVTVPDPLRDPATNTLRSVPCMTDANCPQVPGVAAPVRCVANACDPDPIPADVSTVVDLSSNEQIRRFGSGLTRVLIARAEYTAASSGFRNAVGPTDLRWGAESVANFDADGAQAFDTLPVIEVADGQTAQGEVTLDAAGVAALSDYLATTSLRIRVFARPRIDLAPGGPLPAGQISLQMRLTVRIQGQLTR